MYIIQVHDTKKKLLLTFCFKWEPASLSVLSPVDFDSLHSMEYYIKPKKSLLSLIW